MMEGEAVISAARREAERGTERGQKEWRMTPRDRQNEMGGQKGSGANEGKRRQRNWGRGARTGRNPEEREGQKQRHNDRESDGSSNTARAESEDQGSADTKNSETERQRGRGGAGREAAS